MFTVRSMIFVKMVDGVSAVRVELDVDTAADLPAADSVSGYLLWQGSIAHDISTGDFYALDSEGTWYAQDGSGAYEPEEVQNSPQNLNLSPLSFGNVSLQPDIITPDVEPVSVLNGDVSDNIVGEIEQTDTPVEFTEVIEGEGTGETMEEVLGNELNVIADKDDE